MTDRRLADLAALAAMLRDRDLARLAAVSQKGAAMAGEIAALQAGLAARQRELETLPQDDAAFAAGADIRWQAHLDRRQDALRQQLAQAMAEREEAREAARRALGRAEVLDRLSRPR